MQHAHDTSARRAPRARAAVVPAVIATSHEVALLFAGIAGLLLLVLLL